MTELVHKKRKERRCKCCGNKRLLTSFYKSHTEKEGRSWTCKYCRTEQRKERKAKKEGTKENDLAVSEEKGEEQLDKLSRDNKPAIPLSDILEKIKKIGHGKVADDLGFPVNFINSWKLFAKGDVLRGWAPRGRIMEQLQEYLKNVED